MARPSSSLFPVRANAPNRLQVAILPDKSPARSTALMVAGSVPARRSYYEGERLGSVDRAVGTHLAGAFIREGFGAGPLSPATIAARGQTDMASRGRPHGRTDPRRRNHKLAPEQRLAPRQRPGRFQQSRIKIVVEGGAQDGVGKGSLGGSGGSPQRQKSWGDGWTARWARALPTERNAAYLSSRVMPTVASVSGYRERTS